MWNRRIVAAATIFALTLAFSVMSPSAQNGTVSQTPRTPMELPVEVEIELSPAGSLKQAALWKELVQLLENPYSITCTNPADFTTCTATGIQRRPGFGVAMPALNMYPLNYNFLTAQPMRLRTSDGEVSWDQPGPLFDTEQVVTVDAFNTPTQLRTVVGHLVACPEDPAYPYQAATLPANFCDGKPDGSLVVYNNTGNTNIPPNGTVVAVSALNGSGELLDEDGVPIGELEAPVNEEHFFQDETTGVITPLWSYVGRPAAEMLGKALFWDMQVGSDGVQACGTCHFHAGADNRTKGQLNSNTTGADNEFLNVHINAGRPNQGNQEVVASDFPFHKRDPEVVGDGLSQGVATSDANDVMSSMGVSRFKTFIDIPPIGFSSFLAPSTLGSVRPLAPDRGAVTADPVVINEGFRRVEPRNTPTFHNAAFNLNNFWDTRAQFIFQGGSVFGASDPQYHIWVNNGTSTGAIHGLPDPEDNELPLHMWQGSVPARIKFSSLASQAVGPPLSDFEMSFAGRNWAKIGKKLLQNGVRPLANQLVAPDDSVLGHFSNQRPGPGQAPTAQTIGRPGLLSSITYPNLIRAAFKRQLWASFGQHFNGAPCADPFDGYCLTLASGSALATNTNQFTHMEANFALFFGLAVQAYEALTISDDTPVDKFFDANPNAGHGVGEPGDQAVLFPTLIPDLMDDGLLNNSGGAYVTLVPGFGPDELFGFDIFAGANLTAALDPAHSVGASGRNRNPSRTITNALGQQIQIRPGSNPFTRSAKCMLCHLGPEQTDHSINISHGLLKNDAEFEYPVPPRVPDPQNIFADGLLPAPEPSGSSRTVGGLVLSEEITEGPPQDSVEVEPRNFATFDDPNTPWDDRIISQPQFFAFGDQGVYNLGLRPASEDIGLGGPDPWGWPLSKSALSLMNIAGATFDPCDGPLESCVMPNFDPNNIEATFEETGDGAVFPNTMHELDSINPGFERRPIVPQLPAYLAPWVQDLPAGELHPQIDEMAGMVPNTITPPNGGPAIEFPEILFGADNHCATYDPATFGFGPPNWGWGPPTSTARLCPQNQSGVSGNFAFPSQGTWPVPNRVLRNAAFKAPGLRNVELTGPYFHTGSYLTLRQVVDFYFRGGDFPITNADNRDPNIVDLDMHAFAFGRTTGDDLRQPINMDAVLNSPTTPYLAGPIGFGDGLPDTVFLYDEYPDSDHPYTPEPVFASRAEALEDAKNSLVKFLIALTDDRVRYEKAPFDRPQIFVPIDGRAPDNTGGQAQLLAQSNCSVSTPCRLPGPDAVAGNADDVIVTTPVFRNHPAVGAAGNATPTPAFLNVTNIPPGAPGYNCSAGLGPVSHFCAVVTQ